VPSIGGIGGVGGILGDGSQASAPFWWIVRDVAPVRSGTELVFDITGKVLVHLGRLTDGSCGEDPVDACSLPMPDHVPFTDSMDLDPVATLLPSLGLDHITGAITQILSPGHDLGGLDIPADVLGATMSQFGSGALSCTGRVPTACFLSNLGGVSHAVPCDRPLSILDLGGVRLDRLVHVVVQGTADVQRLFCAVL
jgi:hypothetical protein